MLKLEDNTYYWVIHRGGLNREEPEIAFHVTLGSFRFCGVKDRINSKVEILRKVEKISEHSLPIFFESDITVNGYEKGSIHCRIDSPHLLKRIQDWHNNSPIEAVKKNVRITFEFVGVIPYDILERNVRFDYDYQKIHRAEIIDV